MTPDPCFPSGSDEHQCRLRAVAAAGSSGTIVACRPFISRLLGAANLGFPVLIRPNFLFADTHVESIPTKDLPGGIDDANQPGGVSQTFSLANLAKYPHPKWRLDQ